MDIANTLRLEANPDDDYREACNRRGHSDRDRIRDFYNVCEVLDGNENAGHPLERRERMAEAMYDI